MRYLGKKTLILPVAISLILFMIFAIPVLAAPGLFVKPVVLGADIAPGESGNFILTVANESGDAPMDIVVDVMGLGQTLDGGYRELSEDNDSSPYSARSFIDISPDEFRLEPDGSRDIDITVTVPDGIGDGGRYACIYVHSKADTQSGTSIVPAIGASVVLTLAGTDLTRAGSITGIDIGEPVSNEPLNVTAVLENTGNYHYKARAEAALKDDSGNELAIISSAPGSSIVPACSRQFDFLLSPAAELTRGTYYVDLNVYLDDDTILASQTEAFEIKRAYSPHGPDETLPTINWSMIIVVFGAGCLFATILYFVMNRRKANRL
jgi:hypothetical protein